MTKNYGSHQADALGGRSKESQRRPIPEAVDMPTDADVIQHLRERERANAATSASVAGIPELTPHANKKDLPPTAPGKSTRVDRGSDGVISQPHSDARPQQHKDSTDPCDSLSESQIKRLSRQAPGDAKERPVEKLHQTKARQFRNGNTN
jgi:hypothetical protein